MTSQALQKDQTIKHGRKTEKSALSAEFIHQQRALKKEAKEQKLQRLKELGIDPTPPDLRFIKREMLAVPHQESIQREGLRIKMMTYNCLAQTLVRREQFPSSGDALKWSKRCQVLLGEIKFYNCDVLCLQEVDHIHFHSFWQKELERAGYQGRFHRFDGKNHGVCIFWRKSLFKLCDVNYITFDTEETGDIHPRTSTRNTAILAALEFNSTEKYRGIIVGTTHLYWHPFGTFERTRQTYILLRGLERFHQKLTGSWFRFLTGDFNSQPFDAPYLSVTRKPISYEKRCKTVIECSTSYDFSENSEGDPVPKTFHASDAQKELCRSMQEMHNSLNQRAISLYSIGYNLVHKENSGKDNDRNEPTFSNWADSWTGLLDYIFLVTDWKVGTDARCVESLEQFEAENNVVLNGLLRMPEPKEMGRKPSGQPRRGQYGSDHLCMIADITLLCQ